MFAASGILFNQESPRRGAEFVTRKVSLGAAKIKLGYERQLRLGNLGASRDWGFAGDYVRAMHLMLGTDEPSDYIVGTGVTHGVGELVELAFGVAGLDWRDAVVAHPAFNRPAQGDRLWADPAKGPPERGWRPKNGLGRVVHTDRQGRLEQLSRP